MRRVTVSLPVYLPNRLYDLLRTLRRARGASGSHTHNFLDLSGDRDIEWSWVAAQIPFGDGEALDFGSGPSGFLGLIAAQRGFHMTTIDLEPGAWFHNHPRLESIQGDLFTLALPQKHFDLIINCSAVEHVGLAGRYGVTQASPNGDLEAMARLRSLMKQGGVMLLTIPVGRDAIFAPLHRVYGAERLPKLLKGFAVEKQDYWVKNDQNCWIATAEQEALQKEPRARLYGLGCFVLRRF